MKLLHYFTPWCIFGLLLLTGLIISACMAGDPQNTNLPLVLRKPSTPTPTPTPPTWWRPAPGISWQIQYTGALDLSFDVQMYDLDLFETSQTVIDELHAADRRVVCYFSAGSWEDWRPDAGQFPESVLGNELEGWPGERWLDIRRMDILGPIMAARLDLAAQKGCDGVDPDNVEGYANDSGFALTARTRQPTISGLLPRPTAAGWRSG